MSRRYFGTDGVRGSYGGPVINEDFAARLGFAAARWVGKPGRVVVGRDTRASGPALEAAVMRGLRAAGAEPVSLGVVPTPAVARAVRTEGAVLGVVITASHNPAGDNGIKFFGPGGVKLTDANELAIEQYLPADAPTATAAGPTEHNVATAAEHYIAAARQLLAPGPVRGASRSTPEGDGLRDCDFRARVEGGAGRVQSGFPGDAGPRRGPQRVHEFSEAV